MSCRPVHDVSRSRVFRRRIGTALVVVAVPLGGAGFSPARAQTQDATPLSLSLDQLLDVKVTTVSREESTVGQSAAAVFVITQDMIKRSGCTEIPELFRMVPGMEVARIDSHEWAIGIRGFNAQFSNKLLVQVDGRTVYNPLYSAVYWDGVDYPLEDIERIEIVRGPGGSDWGANAVDGVINIITKPANETLGGLLDVGAGNVDHLSGTVRFGDSTGEDGNFRVYAKDFQEGGEHSEDNGNAFDDWQSGRAGFRYDRTPAGGTNFTIQGDAYAENLGEEDSFPNIKNPPSFSTTGETATESSGGNLLARWTHQRDENSSWTLQAYYDNDERTITNGVVKVDIDSADIDFQQQLGLGSRNKLLYGFGYLSQTIDLDGSDAIDGGTVALTPAGLNTNRDVASTFLQDTWKLSHESTFTVGSKLEHNYYTGLVLEPSARLLYAPSSKRSAWASISRSVRTPSFPETNIAISLSPDFLGKIPVFIQERGNPNLGSEDVVAYESGYRTQATKSVSLDAAVYYNQYHDLVVATAAAPATLFVPGPIPGSLYLPLEWENDEGAHSDGFELSSTWDLTPHWKLTGAYTYLDMTLNPSAGLGAGQDATLSNDAGNDPKNQLYLRSSHQLSNRIELDLVGRYVSSLPNLDVPAYTTGDAQITWKKSENLAFSLSGQNLFQANHLEFTGDLIPVEVERSVYFKVTRSW